MHYIGFWIFFFCCCFIFHFFSFSFIFLGKLLSSFTTFSFTPKNISSCCSLKLSFISQFTNKNKQTNKIYLYINIYPFFFFVYLQRGSDELLSQAAIMAPASDNNNQDLATKKAKLDSNTVINNVGE